MSYMADIARSVVRYQPADKAALREFQRAHFGERARQCDDTFAEWLFERNPNRDADGPALWLCKRDGVVVGQQAGIPVILKVGDRECRATWNIDWMVHPAWRMKGVAPALFAAFAESTDVLLGLGVEEVPYRSFVRSGWIDTGSLALFVRPLDPAACANGLNAPRLLTRLAPAPLFRGSAAFAGRAAAALARVSLDPVSAFDERVDGVWQRASKDYPVLVKRDFAFLSWRYDATPHRIHYARYYMMRRGEVLGYVVVRLEPWHGHVIARVVDYLAPRRWMPALLALTIGNVNAQGAVAVFIEQHNAEAAKLLWSLACVRVRASHKFMLKLRDRTSSIAGQLTHAANWFVMPGDGDYDQVMIEAE
jgi:hypothetical protein